MLIFNALHALAIVHYSHGIGYWMSSRIFGIKCRNIAKQRLNKSFKGDVSNSRKNSSWNELHISQDRAVACTDCAELEIRGVPSVSHDCAESRSGQQEA